MKPKKKEKKRKKPTLRESEMERLSKSVSTPTPLIWVMMTR